MTDQKTPHIDGDADKAARHRRQKELDDIKFSVAQAREEDEREVRLLMARNIRLMRIAAVVGAMATPLVLLWLLLSRVYFGLPMLITESMKALKASESLTAEKMRMVELLAQKADDISAALSAPLTALIIGTFASFIIVYSALLIGVFRGESREKDAAMDAFSTTQKSQEAMNSGFPPNSA